MGSWTNDDSYSQLSTKQLCHPWMAVDCLRHHWTYLEGKLVSHLALGCPKRTMLFSQTFVKNRPFSLKPSWMRIGLFLQRCGLQDKAYCCSSRLRRQTRQLRMQSGVYSSSSCLKDFAESFLCKDYLTQSCKLSDLDKFTYLRYINTAETLENVFKHTDCTW